jgi:hypothetical protein
VSDGEPVWRGPRWTADTGCLEVAEFPNGDIGIRNSRKPKAMTRCTRSEWADFERAVTSYEFASLRFPVSGDVAGKRLPRLQTIGRRCGW